MWSRSPPRAPGQLHAQHLPHTPHLHQEDHAHCSHHRSRSQRQLQQTGSCSVTRGLWVRDLQLRLILQLRSGGCSGAKWWRCAWVEETVRTSYRLNDCSKSDSIILNDKKCLLEIQGQTSKGRTNPTLHFSTARILQIPWNMFVEVKLANEVLTDVRHWEDGRACWQHGDSMSAVKACFSVLSCWNAHHRLIWKAVFIDLSTLFWSTGNFVSCLPIKRTRHWTQHEWIYRSSQDISEKAWNCWTLQLWDGLSLSLWRWMDVFVAVKNYPKPCKPKYLLVWRKISLVNVWPVALCPPGTTLW